MADSDHGIHVLLLPYPAQGHINPLLQFGKRLVAGNRGVRCTLAVTRWVLSSSTASPGGGGGVHVATISDGCDSCGYDEVGDVATYLDRLESAGSATLHELLGAESGQGRPVHAVVYDAFLPWAPRVARRHGAGCAAFFTQACAVNVAYAHAWSGRVKLPLSMEAPAPALPGLPTGLEPVDFPTFLTEPASCSAYHELVLQQCEGLETADHVLINSFYELQPKEAEYMVERWGSMTVGPTIPSAYLDKRMPKNDSYSFQLQIPMMAQSKAWIDERTAHSVVYVSFGSLATPSHAQVAELADGLYNSGMAFLWVVRASEASKIPDDFASRVKTRGLIVTWSPQLEVLAHPAVGCFVTHCGWNSTMEGLGAGVPMVAMPQWSDQTMNGKYIEDVWRVGVRVWPDEEGIVRSEEVERCVREVMEGERSNEYRRNAVDWSEKARKAMSEGGSSDINIVEFLNKVGLKI